MCPIDPAPFHLARVASPSSLVSHSLPSIQIAILLSASEILLSILHLHMACHKHISLSVCRQVAGLQSNAATRQVGASVCSLRYALYKLINTLGTSAGPRPNATTAMDVQSAKEYGIPTVHHLPTAEKRHRVSLSIEVAIFHQFRPAPRAKTPFSSFSP